MSLNNDKIVNIQREMIAWNSTSPSQKVKIIASMFSAKEQEVIIAAKRCGHIIIKDWKGELIVCPN